MNDTKKLRRLNRLQLLEIMYEQEQRIKKLEAKNEYLKNYIRKQNKELNEQKEIINLLSKLGRSPSSFNLEHTLTIKSNESLNQQERRIAIPNEMVSESVNLNDNG